MIGGSALPQASGAPFRTESDSRASAWPPPAHQNDLFNRGFGIYSLFPQPGDNAKTLYTTAAAAAASAAKSDASYSRFLEPQKTSESFFPGKLSFACNGTSEFEPQRNSIIQPGISPRLELTGKGPFNPSSPAKNFPSPPIKAQRSGEFELDSAQNIESKSKPSFDEVLVIKSEVEEGIRKNQKEICRLYSNEKKEIKTRFQSESKGAFYQVKQANEPDSTDGRALCGNLEGDTIIKGSGIEEDKLNVDLKEKEVAEDFDFSHEKNDVKVVDLSLRGSSGKSTSNGGTRSHDSANDLKAKIPDSSCSKSLTVNCRPYGNESAIMSKPSPMGRMISLPLDNGGCSRTMPVTFKHSPQSSESTDSKSQVGSTVNVPSPVVSIKMEPVEFPKYPNGPPFLGFAAPLNNLFNPNTLRVFDGQLINSVPYSDSYETYSRRKETYLSTSNVDENFLRSSQNFLSLRSNTPGTSYLNPKIEVGDLNDYKFPKMGEVYPKKFEAPSNTKREEGDIHDVNNAFVNSTTTEGDKRNCSSGSGSNVTPCQVAEVTSASSVLSPKIPSANSVTIKEEVNPAASLSVTPTIEVKKDAGLAASGQSTAVSSTVGVFSTKPRSQSKVEEMNMSSLSISTPHSSILHRTSQSSLSVNTPSALEAAVYSGGVLCDDRSTSIWSAHTHNSGLWQYSAALDYPTFPPVGFQLIRDPITGHFLLIPAPNLEALQRAILCPTYAPASQMIIPPISLQPSTSHLLLDTTNVSAAEFMSSEALHRTTTPQHRFLIPTDNAASKRKVMGPPLIKFEAPESDSAGVVTSCNSDTTCSKFQLTSLPLTFENRSEFAQCPVKESERSDVQVESATPCLISIPDKIPGKFELPSKTESETKSCPEFSQVKLTSNSDACEFKLFVAQNADLPPKKEVIEVSESIRKKENKETEKKEIEKEGLPEEVDDKRAVHSEIERRKESKESKTDLSENSKVFKINVKQEINSPSSQVDISGLELLSNSIERLIFDKSEEDSKKCEYSKLSDESIDSENKDVSTDACEGAVLLQNLKNGFWESETCDEYEVKHSKSLGGLGLLCALAEQRFQEEVDRENLKSENIELSIQPSEKKQNEDVLKKKKETENGAICEKLYVEESICHRDSKDCDFNSNYRSEYLLDASKKKCDEESYQAVQNNENKLDDNLTCLELVGSEKKGPGRPKKTKCRSLGNKMSMRGRKNRKSKEMSPPVLERQTDYPMFKQETDSRDNFNADSPNDEYKTDVSEPPTLTPNAIVNPACKRSPGLTLPKTVHKVSCKKIYKTEIKPPETEFRKRKSLDSICTLSSSKKRKVKQPRKHHLLIGDENSTTETIVAKKPKTKLNCLYQPFDNPVVSIKRWNGDTSSLCSRDLHNTENDCKMKKIKPKLKAEPKFRESYPMPEELKLESWNKISGREEQEEKNEASKKENVNCFVNGVDEAIESSNCIMKCGKEKPEISENQRPKLPSCALTAEDIKSENCPVRTLTAMGGLFYAGQLSAIRAPDVYGITINGERGNRPHIYSREEILNDTILEVKPQKASDLVPGTRICAYWSEQYRCLYPGTVSAPASPDPYPDDRFISVEFDDGDSGKINIEDIRLLPDDYPIVEYDPNPLQTLSKRRRRISGASVESHSKERKSLDSLTNGSEKLENRNDGTNLAETISDLTPVDCEKTVTFLNLESDRKYLKKKRREKLRRLQSLSTDGKKKHKKHRCSEDHRHHKHHKKHRKHRHKHGTRNAEKEISEDQSLDKKKIEKKLKKCESSLNKSSTGKPKKCKERTESVESRSKMAAFLPAIQLWGWSGKGYKKPGVKGRGRKEFYKAIQRGKERITVGDCAVFLSTGRPDRPYIGRIESMWESWGTNMIVKVKWFYHPEETVGCPATLEYPGALFESPHVDENDVQTISHKCEVLPLKEYTAKLGNSPRRYEAVYDNNDIYYLAGYYDPTNITLKMERGVK